jgi:hypothetical protein
MYRLLLLAPVLPSGRYIKMIVLPQLGKMTIKTTSGEAKTYTDYAELQARGCCCDRAFIVVRG